MGKLTLSPVASVLVLTVLVGCAAPAPTATPTSPPVAVTTPTQAGPTPTKAPTATPTKRPLVKATLTISSVGFVYLPVWVAKAKGYFPEEGLDLEWVLAGSGAKVVASTVGRSTDIGMAAAPEAATAVAQGQPIQAFSVIGTRQTPELVMRPEVFQSKGLTDKSTLEERVKALKGLKIGASSPGSGTDYAIRYLLGKYNMDPERDVEITYVGGTNLLPALRQGAVDVMTKSPPDGSIAEAEGFGKIVISFARGDVPETNDTLYIMALAHRDTMQARPDVMEAFVRGTWRGMRLLKDNLNDARDATYKDTFSDMDQAVYRSSFGMTYGISPDTPMATPQQLALTLDYRNKTEKGPPLEVKFEDFFTTKVVEAAKKQLGY